MEASGRTDTGRRRSQNQDRIFISSEPIGVLSNLYIVADGMGGSNAGEMASSLAIQTFCEYIQMHPELKLDTEEELIFFLKRGVAHTNYIIYQKSISDQTLKGMGTTLTLCTLREGHLYVAHVGDTRVYVLNEEEMIQVTNDHSYVQELVDEGYISKKEAEHHPKRHAITRAIGTYDRVKVDTYKYPLENTEKVILCSDGLTTMLSEDQMKEIICKNDNIQEAVELLISAANESGGSDNIAVIILRKSEVIKAC